jgi:hypothetical protein
MTVCVSSNSSDGLALLAGQNQIIPGKNHHNDPQARVIWIHCIDFDIDGNVRTVLPA